MKNQSIILSLAACGLIALGTGCSKQETTPPPISQAPPPPAPAAPAPPAVDALTAAHAQAAADQQAAAAAAASKLAEAEKAAQAEKLALLDKQAQAGKLAADKQAQLAASGSKVQSLIDSAKRFTGENKWAEALKVLSELANEKLTPAQQTVVDGLKVDAQKQAQAAVTQKASQNAAGAIGGLLGPNK